MKLCKCQLCSTHSRFLPMDRWLQRRKPEANRDPDRAIGLTKRAAEQMEMELKSKTMSFHIRDMQALNGVLYLKAAYCRRMSEDQRNRNQKRFFSEICRFLVFLYCLRLSKTLFWTSSIPISVNFVLECLSTKLIQFETNSFNQVCTNQQVSKVYVSREFFHGFLSQCINRKTNCSVDLWTVDFVKLICVMILWSHWTIEWKLLSARWFESVHSLPPSYDRNSHRLP